MPRPVRSVSRTLVEEISERARFNVQKCRKRRQRQPNFVHQQWLIVDQALPRVFITRSPFLSLRAVAVLHRHGLVKAIGRPRQRAAGTALSPGVSPNDLWCADFKGEFKLGNAQYCYPLTVTDHASRYLLLCEALDSTREDTAIAAFEQLFRDRGLPCAIRSDNGVPFASPNALYNLSKLSVWWLRLGITIERIKPGHPQQNGRHERMHLTLKKEATRPPGMNSLQQGHSEKKKHG
jgi:transposase InsO family protein